MKIGSLIECVNGSFPPDNYQYVPNRPVKGNHYIIREISDRHGNVGVLLEEITNPLLQNKKGGFFEPKFKIARFCEIHGLDKAVEELLEETAFANIN